jgi:hypothetical protein
VHQHLQLQIHPQKLHGEARAHLTAAKTETGAKYRRPGRHLRRHNLAQTTKTRRIRRSASTNRRQLDGTAIEDVAEVEEEHQHLYSTNATPAPPHRWHREDLAY